MYRTGADKSTLINDIKPLKKNRSRLLLFAVILTIGLAAVSLTVAFQKNKKSIVRNETAASAPKKVNELLLQLIPRLNDSSKSFALPKGQKISDIREPIMITKDSFRLVGNGTTLIADSSYSGAAFVINSTAKSIVLDSLVLQNFDIGVIVHKNNVTFRNVRFVNCRIPVEYLVSLPDSVVSGRLKDSIFVTQKKSK